MSTQRDELAADISRSAREIDEHFDIGHESTELADKLLAAGWSKPRTVVSEAELDALPVGSVIWYSLRYDGQAMYSVMEKGLDGTWLSAMDPEDDYAYKPLLPATVLFTPEVTA